MTTTALVRFHADDIAVPLRPASPQSRFEPTALAATDGNIHSGALALALSGYGIFLVASWVGWAFGYTALLIVVIYFLSAMYFGMLIQFGKVSAAARGDVTRRSFGQFLDGRMQTFTGWINGRDALVQVAFMPILLGCTMCVFALLWLTVRG